MYPIYPLIAVMGAFAVVTIGDMVAGIVEDLLGEDGSVRTVAATTGSGVQGQENMKENKKEKEKKAANEGDSANSATGAATTATKATNASNTNPGGEGPVALQKAAQFLEKQVDVLERKYGRSSERKNNDLLVGWGDGVPFTGTWGRVLRSTMNFGCLIAAFVLCFSRTTSNHVNYRGYLNTWKRFGQELTVNTTLPGGVSGIGQQASHQYQEQQQQQSGVIRVCMGSEWFTFPSHFFIPQNVKLEFLRDAFHGQLPQYFASVNGTSGKPLQPFNDLNAEESSRYIDSLSSCDYIVAIMKPDEFVGSSSSSSSSSSDSGSNNGVKSKSKKDTMRRETADSSLSMVKQGPLGVEISAAMSAGQLEVLFSEPIIDPSRSLSSLARAFFIPGYSGVKNRYSYYVVLKSTRKMSSSR
jgi:hypothetical protein